MSDFETWWQQEGQEFLYALNTTTDDDIKLVAEIAWKNGAYCAEQSDMNLNCKSVQKRLATSWGYVKQDDCATALKVIHTWASVEGALVPEHVINLCDKALGRNEK